MLITSAVICMALNVYHEARGEPEDGQIAVAQVTMRRASSDKSAVCEIVAKRKQFSWTNAGAFEEVMGGYRLSAQAFPQESKAWGKAVKVASDVLYGVIKKDRSFGATHYHAKRVAPKWSKSLSKVAVIGRHVFYV